MNAEIRQGIPMGFPLRDWSRLPRSRDKWTTERTTKTHFVLRIRVVRLHDGSTVKYFLQRPRPQSNHELLALETEIRNLQREVDRTRIAVTDRVLLSRKNARNGVRPCRKKTKR